MQKVNSQRKLHHKKNNYVAPPASTITTAKDTLPIIHAIRILHKDIYCTSGKFSKRDKLGIHATVEAFCVEILSLAIEASFKPKYAKKDSLDALRLKTEILKHLIRTENELEIIHDKTYLRFSEQIVEISKMTNGWINFVTEKTRQ